MATPISTDEHDEPVAAAAGAAVPVGVGEQHEVQGDDEPGEHEPRAGTSSRPSARSAPGRSRSECAPSAAPPFPFAAHPASRLTSLHLSRRSGLRKTQTCAQPILPGSRPACAGHPVQRRGGRGRSGSPDPRYGRTARARGPVSPGSARRPRAACGRRPWSRPRRGG